MKKQWQEHFPYEKPRDEQIEIIDFCLNSLQDKRFIVIEAGTGVGKSAIGMTIASYMAATKGWTTHFVTTQKILQDQYINDFAA